MEYTIDNFWVPCLGRSPSAPLAYPLVKGWSFSPKGLPTFQEAPLALSSKEFGEFDDAAITKTKAPVLLVSAPGAVGKSTLARQIAFRTGSIYVNLAESDPVGGNTLSGGLARGKIFSLWERGKITALIDGLDEATLRATKEGFEAFLSDVAVSSENRDVPVVLFGRTRTIQETWLHLTDELGEDVPVFEIGYFEREASIRFAATTLEHRYSNRRHPEVDRKALELLLDSLRDQTESDNNRFAGYAPVIQAVTERVAKEDNPSVIVSKLQREGAITQVLTLRSVVSDILDREQNKLRNLSLEDPELAGQLYSPDEQLQRLVARVYNSDEDLQLPQMSQRDTQTYEDALEIWVGEHPFLDGDTGTSSVVFQAAIAARALKGKGATSRPTALSREIEKGDAANPFLYIFCELSESPSIELAGEHVGVVYASVMASLAQGETASLHIETPDDESPNLDMDGEIEIARRDLAPVIFRFSVDPREPIRLGTYIKDTTVIAPSAWVEIGGSSETLLVAPVNIECDILEVLSSRLIVEAPRESWTDAVLLRANEFSGTPTAGVPITRNGAKLLVTWPGADAYPWNSFAANPSSIPVDDPRLDEALRRFRKFVIEFRAHGNGRLARSKDKIESGRMTKGTGESVINLMLSERIVERDQARYYLDSNRLAELTEATYADFMAYQYGPRTIDFVRKALQ